MNTDTIDYMEPAQIDENTKINYLVPTVVQHGNLINPGVGANGELVFYQVRKVTGPHIDEIDVVASVFVPNLQDLKNYRNAITEAINKVENPQSEPREP